MASRRSGNHPVHDSGSPSIPSTTSTSESIATVPSSRITRSSARQAANSEAGSPTTAQPDQPAAPPPPPPAEAPKSSARKRKSRAVSSQLPPAEPSPPARKSKRQKTTKPNEAPTASDLQPPPPVSSRSRKGKVSAMSSPGSAGGPLNPSGSKSSGSSSRKASRDKKSMQDRTDAEAGPSRSKKSAKKPFDDDVTMTGTDEAAKEQDPDFNPEVDEPDDEHRDREEEHGENQHDDDDEDDDEDHERQRDYDDEEMPDIADPFNGTFGGGPGSRLGGLLGSMLSMAGISTRLRDILTNLKQKNDPSLQLVALQELSELLLVSNEDNLSGSFHPDAYVKELVSLMQPHELTGEENPEIMLLACRCLANLMEALPASVSAIIYNGAVPVLCQKLLEISFIDLAEQALSTLEKISVEYPASIVREGGLTACLSYLEFFATSTQRTAVTTAANCCRNIPQDSFPVVRDVMPILLNVLGSSDQRVVEQASLCVSRIIESFHSYPSKLEELVNVDMLQAILRLLLPGSTNLIGPNIHTQFLRVLGIIAQKSPRLSAELFKLNVVETLYQILTGVSPPSGSEDVASKLDSVLIMQSLIHRPREQIVETLNVICGLLPTSIEPTSEVQFGEMPASSPTVSKKKSSNEKRIELLGECKTEVRRFALILFPTLTDAFSSTVNYDVRNRVLTAHIQMLSNLDRDVLVDALKAVPYASFLGSILSQRDHPLLVKYALDAAELLMSRLDDIYRYQLYREGVITEIEKLSEEKTAVANLTSDVPVQPPSGGDAPVPVHQDDDDDSDDDDDDGGAADDGDDDDDDDGEGHGENASHHSSDDDDDDDDDEDHQVIHHDLDHDDDDDDDDDSVSPVSSRDSGLSVDWLSQRLQAPPPSIDVLAALAKKFLETHETEKHGKSMKKKATKILEKLTSLATEIENFYLRRTSSNLSPEHGTQLFQQLASFFDTDVLESVTSAETLTSGLVRVLEAVFSNPDENLADAARSAFLQVFMGYAVKSGYKTATADSPATPFSVMIHKLQDLLSRSEHFEVLTVHHNAYEGNRSSAASMLAKQLRLKLVADEESNIPKSYRNILVSIHAIATFKTLDDYLRPRIIMSEQPSRRDRKSMAKDLAALANSVGLPLSAAAQRFAERATPLLDGQIPSRPPPPGQQPSTRVSRRSKSKSQPQPETPVTPNQSASARDKTAPRRSARRHPASTDTPPSQPPPEDADPLANALECADERRMDQSDDDDDESALDRAALDAIVGDLDEDMDDEPLPDPSAVHLEVAAGGKVTARKEDGTRVPTPAQSNASALSTEARRAAAIAALLSGSSPTPSRSSGSMSYAAAVSQPQNWHIEFSIDGKVIGNESTIYRAIQIMATNAEDPMGRNLWSAVHTIKFKRVDGPAPAETSAFGGGSDTSQSTSDTVGPLAKNPTTASILRLLKLLHDFNANLEDVFVENKETLRLNVEPLSQFVNTKLTAKLNRQLEEPLIVASNCMPSWSEDLARLYPFLFPFETRHLFLQSTSYGYARSMTRWQNSQPQEDNRRDRRDDRPFLGRLQRQKVRISRTRILESAIKVMELYGAAQSILEVEYFEEVGTGLGPTLEFYSTVSREFVKKKLKLWRDSDSGDGEDFVSSPTGLFPRPLSEEDASGPNGERIMTLFKTLGKFVARSMLDSRIIDVDLNPIFFRIGEEASGIRPSLGAVKLVDPALARSLMLIKKFVLAKKSIEENPQLTAAQKVAETQAITVNNARIEDLSLDFTLPGHPEIDLLPGGSQVNLTIENVDSYLEKVVDMTLGAGVRRQVDAFREGFSKVFPYTALSAFTPTELSGLFGRTDEDWSLETLVDSVKADHGFTIDSRSVKNLLQIMSELDMQQRRDFLQFTTGSPKLPIGGFRSLTPMFTVVCKPSEHPYTSDDYLPSVMTCVNYLKLPDYSNIDIMQKQLSTATKEGQGAFHLS